MDWEDTYSEDPWCLQSGRTHPTRREQAELSFKAGQKSAVDWIKKTGIRIEDWDYYPHKKEKPKILKAVYQHNLDKKILEWGL